MYFGKRPMWVGPRHHYGSRFPNGRASRNPRPLPPDLPPIERPVSVDVVVAGLLSLFLALMSARGLDGMFSTHPAHAQDRLAVPFCLAAPVVAYGLFALSRRSGTRAVARWSLHAASAIVLSAGALLTVSIAWNRYDPVPDVATALGFFSLMLVSAILGRTALRGLDRDAGITRASIRSRADYLKFHSLENYRRRHPKAISQRGAVRCFKPNCPGTARSEKVMNHTFLRRHFCNCCSERLYYTPE